MAAQYPEPAPRKLFREEAKTEAVQCPACGGPITLHGFGAIERVACPYCGSELQPEDSGALQILQHAQRQRRGSALPLYARGTLDGDDWEIIGIVWRECNVDGVAYPWQEFLLFNPYKGYQWLVFSMSDGHWTLGAALPGAPEATTGIGHKYVRFKKDKYKHFQTVMARTTYVEGEFPWQVRVGDQAVAHEFVAPPRSISIEETAGEDGQDVAFTALHHVEPTDVWKAFKLQGNPPPRTGIGSVRPNPWKKGRAGTWISLAVLLLLWFVMTIGYIGSRDDKVVFERSNVGFEPVSEMIEIGEPGEVTTLEFRLAGMGLSNAWAAAEVMLIREGSEEAIGFDPPPVIESWHGVEGGEAWQEGSTHTDVAIGGVEGGKYLLQIVPTGGSQGIENTPPLGVTLSYSLHQDVPLGQYVLLSFLVIIGIPMIYGFMSLYFEGRRWANSDYTSSK